MDKEQLSDLAVIFGLKGKNNEVFNKEYRIKLLNFFI